MLVPIASSFCHLHSKRFSSPEMEKISPIKASLSLFNLCSWFFLNMTLRNITAKQIHLHCKEPILLIYSRDDCHCSSYITYEQETGFLDDVWDEPAERIRFSFYSSMELRNWFKIDRYWTYLHGNEYALISYLAPNLVSINSNLQWHACFEVHGILNFLNGL